MKRESCIALLKLIKRLRTEYIFQDDKFPTDRFFDIPEEIVQVILDINENWKLCDTLLVVTKFIESDKLLEFCNVFVTAEYQFQTNYICEEIDTLNDETIRLTKSIVKCEDEDILVQADKVYNNPKLKQSGASLNAFEIVAKCKRARQAEFVAKALTEENFNDLNKAFEVAQILATCEIGDACISDLYHQILCNEFLIGRGTNLKVGEIVSKVKGEASVRVRYVGSVMKFYNTSSLDDETMDTTVVDECEIAQQIINAPEKFHAYNLMEIFTTETVAYSKDVYDFIPFICATKDKKVAEAMYYVIDAYGREVITIQRTKTQLEDLSGYTKFECQTIDSISVNEALLLMEEEQFELPGEIDGETVKQFIKENNGKKYFVKSKN